MPSASRERRGMPAMGPWRRDIMSLKTRILLTITVLLFVAVGATAAVVAGTARQLALTQMEDNGVLIAGLIARSAGFAVQGAGERGGGAGPQTVGPATVTTTDAQLPDKLGLLMGLVDDLVTSGSVMAIRVVDENLA